MKKNGFAVTELILMIALVLFMVLVGTRAVRTILYPPLNTVQIKVQQFTEYGEGKTCTEATPECEEKDSFGIKQVQ